MGATCSVHMSNDSILPMRMSSVQNYSIDDVKNKFPIVNDEKTFREYIEYARDNNHMMQIYKYLVENNFIQQNNECVQYDTKAKLSTGTKPFNVFARLASYAMENHTDQTIIEEYMEDWMVCHNKPENDMNWNDVNNKACSMCGPDDNGPGHVFITTKNLHWKNFNITTIVLSKNVEFLMKLKEVAEEYVTQRKWKKVGFYFHCFPHNSVNSLHLHIVNENEKYIGHMHGECAYKNLPLDVAIEVAKSL